jgi:hypothetical protein
MRKYTKSPWTFWLGSPAIVESFQEINQDDVGTCTVIPELGLAGNLVLARSFLRPYNANRRGMGLSRAETCSSIGLLQGALFAIESLRRPSALIWRLATVKRKTVTVRRDRVT